MNVITKASLQEMVVMAERFDVMSLQDQAAFLATARVYMRAQPQDRRAKFVRLLSLITGKDFHGLLAGSDIDVNP